MPVRISPERTNEHDAQVRTPTRKPYLPGSSEASRVALGVAPATAVMARGCDPGWWGERMDGPAKSVITSWKRWGLSHYVQAFQPSKMGNSQLIHSIVYWIVYENHLALFSGQSSRFVGDAVVDFQNLISHQEVHQEANVDWFLSGVRDATNPLESQVTKQMFTGFAAVASLDVENQVGGS